MMKLTDNWGVLHEFYKKEDWIKLPSIFAQQAVEYFPTRGKILELGAGLGQDSIYFASKGFEVTCTDFDITSASSAIGEDVALSSKIDIQQLDLRDSFDLRDETYDVVYAHLSLHYFDHETTGRIFDDIHRVLKPNGVIAFFTNSTSDPEYGTGKEIEADYFDIDGTAKRYLSIETAGAYANKFTTILLDDNGETYKDSAKGIHHLIRYVGRK